MTALDPAAQAAPPPPAPASHRSYGAGNLGVQLLAQTFATYATFFYVDHLGVDPALIGVAMVVHGVLSAVLNPLFGHLSDRTRSRWGRRVPYIAFGMAPLAAAFVLVWFPLVSGPAALFWYFLAVVLAFDVLFVLVALNYSALFPELFTGIAARATASSWRQMFGIVGMVAGVAAAPLLYGGLGWGAMGAVLGLVVLGSLALSLRGIPPASAASAPPATVKLLPAIRYTLANRAFVTYVAGSFLLQLTVAVLQASLPFFTKYALREPDSANTAVLGAIFVTAIPLVYVWARVTRRLGPRRTVLAVVAVYAAAFPFFLVAGTTAATVAVTAFMGLGIAGILMLLEILLAEVIDDDERRTGARREGMYFGMNGFIVKWSSSLQAVVLSAVLSASGYVAGAAAQPDTVVTGVRVLLGVACPLVLVPALACFLLYPLRTGR
ncbi:MFS transporter [Nonomuraea pusilla]|uniref:Glycoside/pentoside/hexuronide:cation symporter, GPH family n=1 Tax=Nonomuraea pusilla TaxID=46177 RepID=A0A1H7YH41_9ACTN|nr:MFS transporter [Nonomuraea pusilla]SEM45204.1 glycoside/pentoside/hexuronide:cation symporter, GPH family [Nonomuraea pusilla]